MTPVALPRREFFQRFHPRVLLPIVVLFALLAAAVLFAVWAQRAAAPSGDDFASAFIGGAQRGAGIGAAVGAAIVLVPVLWSTITLFKRPILVLDSSTLRLGRVNLRWDAISEAYPCDYRGLKLVAIRTLNDDAVLRRLRLAALWAAPLKVRRRRIGALFAVPEVRELSSAQLAELIGAYRTAAHQTGTQELKGQQPHG